MFTIQILKRNEGSWHEFYVYEQLTKKVLNSFMQNKKQKQKKPWQYHFEKNNNVWF